MNPKWLVAVSVALGALIEIIDTSIINVALPQMQATLGATLTQVSWVITSYAIANVIVLPLAAWLGHRFGRKRYFLFSLFGFTAASMMCGMSTSLPMLVLARLLQGLTGGGLVSKAQTILFETFPREEQPVAQAFFGAIVIAGPAIGPTLGGYLVTNYAWQWIFFINLPIGVAAVFMVSTFLPDDDPADRIDTPTDWTALLMLAVGLGCLQTFLEEGNADDWFDSWFIRCMALGAVVGVVAFVRRQLRSDAPIVDLKVLREGSLAAGCVLGVVVGASLYGALFCVPIFAQTQLRFTSEQTGWLLLPGALASAVAIQVAGRAARRSDPRLVLVGGASVLIVSLVWIAGLMSPQTSEDDLYWPLIVRSIGTVLMFLPLQLAAIGSVPRPHIAAATGIFNLMRQLGGSVGVAALATVLDRRITFHAQVVGDHLVATDPRVLERVAALTRGFAVHDPARAHAQALAALSMQVRSQASVLAFADTFLITAGLLVLTLPLVALLKAPTAAVEPGGH
ncbi:MAG TPA: DHA2 family efflux MFS transporter permease subunit [Myxococcota bacterium]|nr:DHA2 family efflux MFS transporter permease subunit [Myxococcota bacterium]